MGAIGAVQLQDPRGSAPEEHQQHVTSALLVPGREVVPMLEERRPRRDDRPGLWPIVTAVTSAVRTVIDIWRFMQH